MSPRAQDSRPSSDTLEQLFTGLYATGTVPLPFMDGVDLRSFVLQTQQGVVVVYNTPGVDAAATEIQALGQPTRLLINHYHEEMYGQPSLDVPVYVHERDRAGIESSMRVAGVFTERQKLGDDLEVIPSFSHTPGTTFYLWNNGEHRFLFPGDAIWVVDGVWRAVILGESDRNAFLDTATLLRDLDFDVLVPWPAQHAMAAYDVVTPAQKREQLDNLIARIRAGGAGPRV